MSGVQSKESESDLWQEVADRLRQDFVAERVLVLLEENPEEDFQLAASRGLESGKDWEDQVCFDILVDTYEEKQPRREVRPLPSMCALIKDAGGILGLLYVDRDEREFSETELKDIAKLGTEVTSWMDTINSKSPGGFSSQEEEVAAAPRRASRTDLALEALNSKIVFLMLANGAISGSVAQEALKQAESLGSRVDKILAREHGVDEGEIVGALASHYGLETVQVEEDALDRKALDLLTPQQASRLEVLPLSADRDRIRIATSSLQFEVVEEEVASLTGREVEIVLTERSQLDGLLERYEQLARPKRQIRRETDQKRKQELEKRAETKGEHQRFSAQQNSFSSTSRQGIVGGRYVLKEELMVCRFSTLYYAHDRASGNPVVLRKLELPASSQNRYREARLQILREGRVLSKLTHPNLPRVQEIIEDGEDMYLVLEEIAGDTLENFVEKFDGPLPPELIRRLMNQFLSVLEFLHSQDPPIIHRDLRPETILITPHGTLKIAEFGLAKMQEGAEEGSAAAAGTAFRAQGSPSYASPEQILGEPSHPGNDFYSVGALLYFLSTQIAPPNSTERCFGQDTMVPLSESRSDFPTNLCDAIHSLMEPQAETRPDSVAQVHEMLSEEVELFEEEMSVPQSLVVEADDFFAAEVVAGPDEQDTAERSLPSERETEAGAGKMVKSFAKKLSMWQVLFGKKDQDEDSEDSEEDEVVIDFEQEYRETFGFEDLSEFPIQREIGRLLPETLCKATGAICLERLNENELRVAVKEPDIHLADNIFIATKGVFRADLVRAEELLIDHAIEYIFDSDHIAESTTWMQYLEQKQFEEEELELTSAQAEAFSRDEIEGPIVDAVDRLIKEAIATGASDIHLEPFDEKMNLRYRVDGVLHQINAFDPTTATSMIKRVKVMANMDIAQERVTQGGRISIRVGSSDFDLRVSILPVPSGESCVMRVLKKGSFNLRLPDLGFDSTKEAKYRKILAQPYGLILVCGPTGSGKSTTLYASLKEIQRPDRKLITAEDPIEYQMPGITQVQMNTAPREDEKKVTFAKALREFLRHDPDVILVGEIRDPETANISIQAALTGHLLLSTIHTNDAIGIVARLKDMGCEPFLVGSTLLGGLGQRLARRICSDCREQIEVPEAVIHLFENEGITEPKMFQGVGCTKCNHTGYQGRVALYELLEITSDLRALVNASASEKELREAADATGFEPLLSDGMRKVVKGMVTLEEVQRVCKTL